MIQQWCVYTFDTGAIVFTVTMKYIEVRFIIIGVIFSHDNYIVIL